MHDSLDRVRAALAAQYDVEREIGAGGMATVWLARDLKHQRQVAIKVLRPDLAAALGAPRFLREIEIAARLTHPNILPVFDSGESNGVLWYAMPFVEGESLRTRLAREGPLAPGEVARLLRDVVDALGYAHQRGVVHRDIKPDNILLSGRHALVADFGVAKAVSAATGAQGLTTVGMALGTPAYMAPEQAAADPAADQRVDLYAVGIVAYELLTGVTPFGGKAPQAILAAQLTEAPAPPSTLRAGIPAPLEALVMRCLEKRAADRVASADALMPTLDALATSSDGVTPAQLRAATGATGRGRRVAITAGVVGVAALGAIGFWASGRGPSVADLRVESTTQLTLDPGIEIDAAPSPDGKMVAMATGPVAATRIVVRQLGTGGRELALTDSSVGAARRPHWTPDGASIVFETASGLYLMPALGGQPRLLGKGVSATVSPDGQEIAFVSSDSILRMPIAGGAPRVVSVLRSPHSLSWSPDGRWIAGVRDNATYTTGTNTLGNIAPSALVIMPADGGTPIELTERTTLNVSPAWLGPGLLAWVSNREGARDVWTLQLDEKGRAAGPPKRLTTGLNLFSIAADARGSMLAYSVHQRTGNLWSVPLPEGRVATMADATPVTSGAQMIEGNAISVDGATLAYDSDRSGNQDIYRVAAAGGEPIRLTEDPGDDFMPMFSRDGRRIIYYSWRSGSRDLWVMNADGSEKARVTSDSTHEFYPDWSPDGREVVFLRNARNRNFLEIIRESAPGTWSAPRVIVQSDVAAGYPRWSPDGAWIAFPRRSGVSLVHPDGTGEQLRAPVRLAPAGDLFTAWSADGRTLFWKVNDGRGRATIWSASPNGGPIRRRADIGDDQHTTLRPEFSADGRRALFTVNRHEADVWVMKLKRNP